MSSATVDAVSEVISAEGDEWESAEMLEPAIPGVHAHLRRVSLHFLVQSEEPWPDDLMELGETVASEDPGTEEQALGQIVRQQLLEDMGRILTRRQKEVIALRCGFDGRGLKDDEEVARLLGVEGATVSALARVAMWRLGAHRDEFRKYRSRLYW